jgi:hypothetical protein
MAENPTNHLSFVSAASWAFDRALAAAENIRCARAGGRTSLLSHGSTRLASAEATLAGTSGASRLTRRRSATTVRDVHRGPAACGSCRLIQSNATLRLLLRRCAGYEGGRGGGRGVCRSKRKSTPAGTRTRTASVFEGLKATNANLCTTEVLAETDMKTLDIYKLYCQILTLSSLANSTISTIHVLEA